MKNKPVILVVDDEPQNIELLEAHLVSQNYEIIRAASGEEALEKLSGNQIDLILLDVMMPGMNGFEVTRRVRQDNTHRLLPIILVTVLKETEDRVKGIEAGCDDFISAPVDKTELLARVRSLLKVKAYNDLMSNYQKELESEVTRRTEELKHALNSLQLDITERKQVENALQESEVKYRTLVEKANEAISIVQNGVLVFANDKLSDLLGVPAGALEGKSFIDFVWPEDRELVIANYRKRIAGETIKDAYDFRIIGAGGRLSWIFLSAATIQWKGKPATLNLLTDITERKRAEEALQESEARYRSVLQSATDAIVTVDGGGIIIGWNSGAERIFGYSYTEAVGQSLTSLISLYHHDDHTNGMNEFRSEGGQNVIGKTVEFTGLRKDKSVFPLELSLSTWETKSEQFFTGIIRDITVRKRAEVELKKSESKFRTIFDNASDGMFLVDLNARTFFICNAMCVKMLDYTQEEFLTLDITDIHPSEDIPFINEQIGKFSKGEEGTRSDIRFKRKDGSIFATDLRPALLTITEKKYLLINFNDITERKRAEEALRESELKFRNLFENSLMGISTATPDGRLIQVNLAYAQMYGYDNPKKMMAEVIDVGHQLYVNPEDRKEVMRILDEKGVMEPKEVEVVRRDGTRFFVLVSTRDIRDADGKTLYYQANHIDVTERKRAEELLRRSEEQFRLIAENAADLIAVLDLEGKRIYNSPSYKSILGNPESLLGTDSFQEIHPEDQEKIKRIFLETVRTGIGQRAEYRFLLEDGSVHHIESQGSVVRDENGNANKVVVVSREVTERKRAEEELKKNEEKYRNIFENVQDVYYETSFDGTILEVSPSIEFISKGQYRRADLIGKSMNDFYPDAKIRDAVISAMQKTGSVTDFEVRFKNRDGSFVTCSISSKIKLNAQGRPDKIIGSMHDITERKRAEEALVQEQYLMNMLMDNVPDHIYFKDTDSRFIRISKNHAKKFGLSNPMQATGKTDFDFFTEEHAQPAYEDEKTIIRTGKPIVGIEEKETWPDGRETWVSTTKMPLRDKEGNIIGTFGISRDITERKRAEETLRETRDYLENLLSFANAPIMVWDNNNRITRFNLAFERLTGYTMYDVIGKHPEMLFPAEMRKDLSALISRTSDGENLISIEMPVRCKDGSTRNVLWNTANIYTVDAKTITATIAHGQDITKRKQVEEALQENELRFRSLYENTTVGLYRTTPEGAILMANPALVKMLGYTTFQKLAERNLEKDGFESTSQRNEFIEKIERDGEIIGHDSKWVRQDGAAIFVVESARAIRDSQGKTLYYDGTVEDITERRQMEEGLRQMQKLEGLGTLAGGIAHDFNNILGIILAYITSTRRYKDDAKKLDLAVDTIVKAVERGKTLVHQILTFARKTETEFGAVKVNEVVMEVMAMIFETFPKILTYTQNIDKGISYINADRSQLHQLLLNLCVNARDAMPNGGVLTINTRMVSVVSLRYQHPDAAASSYVCIEVSDTGEGMTPETRGRIFEPFYTTKEQGKGTGLGLAVVFGVVQSHHGFIDVASELGKGTTFSIYLPASQVAEPISVKDEETLQEIQGGTETLLVVEDEEMLMMSLQMILVEKGYKVLSAGDGLAAVNIYKERKKEIALVLTDLGLPKMSGKEECAEIKKLNPSARMIVATGYLDSGMKSEFLKAGIQHFLYKPYDLKKVLKVIREVLDEK